MFLEIDQMHREYREKMLWKNFKLFIPAATIGNETLLTTRNQHVLIRCNLCGNKVEYKDVERARPAIAFWNSVINPKYVILEDKSARETRIYKPEGQVGEEGHVDENTRLLQAPNGENSGSSNSIVQESVSRVVEEYLRCGPKCVFHTNDDPSNLRKALKMFMADTVEIFEENSKNDPFLQDFLQEKQVKFKSRNLSAASRKLKTPD